MTLKLASFDKMTLVLTYTLKLKDILIKSPTFTAVSFPEKNPVSAFLC